MNVEEKLEQAKQDFIKGYIDPYLDRLLDLRNAIRNAYDFDEISSIMEKERDFIKAEFGFNKPEEAKSENKEANLP